MENWKTVHLDDPSQWPRNARVEMETPHVDQRGSIQLLVNFPAKNVTLIESKKGSIRANHYHKTDWHYMYMLSGSAYYYFKPTGSSEPPRKIPFNKGDMVFTPPMEDHATEFLEDSVFLAISRNPRDQESYEADVVRTKLI